MKGFFKIVILSALCVSIALSDAFAHNLVAKAEFEKTIDEKFTFSTSSPDISINNKYGEINLISSDRSDALVEVTISVETKNESRANDIFDKIDIEFENSSNSMEAKTEIDGWGWTKNNEKYRIDYTVYLPVNAQLTLSNKYGDISLTDHNGNVNVDLKYGNGNFQNIGGSFTGKLGYADRFRMGTVHGEVELDASYSKFSMQDSESVSCQSKYSNLTFENTGNFTADTKYDKIYVDKADVIRVEGKYDEINIGSVGRLIYDMDYTSLKVDVLEESGKFGTKYGKVIVSGMSDKAEEITVDANYTDYQFSTHNSFDLKIDTKYTSVHYPDDINIHFRERDSNELALEGTKGSNPRLSIRAKMKYGGLKIREN